LANDGFGKREVNKRANSGNSGTTRHVTVVLVQQGGHSSKGLRRTGCLSLRRRTKKIVV